MDDFYVNITHKAAHEFYYQLPTPIHLEGKWTVTLVDLHTPQVNNVENSTVSYQKGGVETFIPVPDGYYGDDRSLSYIFTTKKIPITLIKRGNLVIGRKDQGVASVKFVGTIADVLGFPEDEVITNVKGVDFDPDRPIKPLIITCDIVESEFDGQNKEPILTPILNPKKIKNSGIHNMLFRFKTPKGQDASFSKGDIRLTLAFRKR